jgi:hypothetical protein
MLEVGVDRVLNGRILQEVMLVDDGVLLGDGLLVLTLAALEECRPRTLFDAVHHVVALGTELHCVDRSPLA